MSIAMLDHQGPWSFEEFVQLEGEHGERFELVDGALIVSPPPPVLHQAVARRLFRQLDAQCPADLEVVYAVALRLGEDGRIPDLSVVRRSAPSGRGIPGYEPELLVLAVEVVSPGSRTRDRPGGRADRHGARRIRLPRGAARDGRHRRRRRMADRPRRRAAGVT